MGYYLHRKEMISTSDIPEPPFTITVTSDTTRGILVDMLSRWGVSFLKYPVGFIELGGLLFKVEPDGWLVVRSDPKYRKLLVGDRVLTVNEEQPRQYEEAVEWCSNVRESFIQFKIRRGDKTDLIKEYIR